MPTDTLALINKMSLHTAYFSNDASLSFDVIIFMFHLISRNDETSLIRNQEGVC